MIEPMVRHRVKIRFRKLGNLCFIGHRDMMRTIERLLRRSKLPVAMSEGFHPKVRMSFPSALALGVSGEAEVMELDLTENLETETILQSLNDCSVEGLSFYSAVKVSEGVPKARVTSDRYEMLLPENLCEKTSRLINPFLAQHSVWGVKSNGKSVDIRSAVLSLRLEGNCLKMELAVTSGSDAGFREVLDILELRAELFRTIFPVRAAVHLAESQNLKQKNSQETPLGNFER
jgi:radical SAM-linked protein